MDETLKKADLEGLRHDLRTELRAVEKRLGARIDGVDKRFDGVDKRLDGVDKKVDALAKEVHRVAIDVESVKDDVKKVAEGVAGLTVTFKQHIRRSDAEHKRLEGMTLAGDAALDKRVTALQQHRQG